MTRCTILIATLAFSACLRAPKMSYPRFDDTEFGGRFAGFAKSPMEHIIVEMKDPIVLREVQGVLRSAGGEWPENVEIVFEIRAQTPRSAVRTVLTDPRGRFHLNNVPVGSYMFKATANGWQSVVGTIIVSKNAKANQVDLLMPVGV
jgi:Carboxypeptidase regulatory-like domain